MTAKETLRFLKNNDTSTVGFKRFAASPQDMYPAFSVCLTDDGRSQEEGSIYSYFKDEIASTMNNRYASHSKLGSLICDI